MARHRLADVFLIDAVVIDMHRFQLLVFGLQQIADGPIAEVGREAIGFEFRGVHAVLARAADEDDLRVVLVGLAEDQIDERLAVFILQRDRLPTPSVPVLSSASFVGSTTANSRCFPDYPKRRRES